MKRVALLALPLAVLTVLASGCSVQSRFTDCSLLKADALPQELAGLKVARQDRTGPESITCEWQAGSTKVAALIQQQTSYEEGESRADDSLERQWREDDKIHVTHRVSGVGDAAYRYTTILDDVVTSTVKAYLGFREVKVELTTAYTSDDELARLEKATAKVASALVVAE